MVYIEEAHPIDAWQVAENRDEKILFRAPRSLKERMSVARNCVADLRIEFPALVDDENNSTERAYTAWPDRLYLVDLEGRIAFKSPPGPHGFEPSKLQVALQRILLR